jgi:4a-hydroxytetrahydrobiopterin dehydratase
MTLEQSRDQRNLWIGDFQEVQKQACQCRIRRRNLAPGKFPPIHNMSDLLEADDLTAALKKCPEWEYEKNALTRTLEFEEFNEAIDFVNDLAEIAEEAQHHPEITIRHTRVGLKLTTHDAGGVTELDIELAQRVDNLMD